MSHPVDFLPYIQPLPSLESLIAQSADDAELLYSWPGSGREHNLQNHHDCWCFPQAACIIDQDGLIGIIIVNHRWEQ